LKFGQKMAEQIPICRHTQFLWCRLCLFLYKYFWSLAFWSCVKITQCM